MRILIAQINPVVGDLKGNTAKIISAISVGKQKQVDLVLFPELALTGYPPCDFLLLPHFIDDVEKFLKKIIKASDSIACIVGLPRKNLSRIGKPLYNSAAVIENGALLGFQDKMLLPVYDVFDEARYFEPAIKISSWKIGRYCIGVTICEDLWGYSTLVKETKYHRDPVLELKNENCDYVVNLSASPYHLGKSSSRFSVCAKAARAFGVPLILCNQIGGNDSLIFDGHSLAISADGQLLASGRKFQEDLLFVDFENTKPIPQKKIDAEEELFQALLLGVRDYFRKLGFTRACLGLSGGIDSAVVACIAAEALGFENVFGVNMPSRYSSDGSMHDAKALALALRIGYREIPIEKPFKSYLELLAPAFEGKSADVTEENLQARIRGAILMALSNKHGYVVLSTGNKSELAVGYATLYGDMCGGLSVINDLTKRQVYALAKWINRNGEIIPLSTIQKPPSAELRPEQLDSDSLPDYSIVDTVVEAYIEDHASKEQIAKQYGYPISVVEELIKKIHRSEYKRRQSAPGLKVSPKAFSVGRYFPIVQGFVK
ncbi:MAG: NAD+ synthase [Parachlamydiaceae bacterium]|nr:NAD+ synthase [Parachlamydiaceae bacterium]